MSNSIFLYHFSVPHFNTNTLYSHLIKIKQFIQISIERRGYNIRIPDQPLATLLSAAILLVELSSLSSSKPMVDVLDFRSSISSGTLFPLSASLLALSRALSFWSRMALCMLEISVLFSPRVPCNWPLFLWLMKDGVSRASMLLFRISAFYGRAVFASCFS